MLKDRDGLIGSGGGSGVGAQPSSVNMIQKAFAPYPKRTVSGWKLN
jgi:hypothetical protein